MRTISNDFREALRGIRQLNALVTYPSADVTKYITTEIGDKLTSELEELLTAEKGDVVYEGEQIISINPLSEVQLFKTICKSVTVETREEIPINTWLNVKIGVLVNGAYEFLDFGDYYITESKYNADTNSYILTAYDKMVESMIPYDLEVTYPITIKNLLLAIFRRLNWYSELPTFVNQDKVLSKDLFSNQNLTFRDVLDNISQVIVGNIGFDGKTAKIKYINHLDIENISQNEYITEEDLKDTNVTLNKKYGPVNSIVITQNDVVLNNLRDSVSVETNGLTEYNFSNNLILMNDSDTFITDMFNWINGLEYYLYDFDTIGKLCFEPLDEVIVKIGEDEYKTLILNDDIKLTQGLEETMYVDVPEETTPEYVAVDKTEKKINNALISIDKANAVMVLKVDSEGKIAQVRLDGNADEGTSFDVSADNINLEGYTTINGGFSVDLNGNMTANNGTFNGGEVTLYNPNNETAKLSLISSYDTNLKVSINGMGLALYGGNTFDNKSFLTSQGLGFLPISSSYPEAIYSNYGFGVSISSSEEIVASSVDKAFYVYNSSTGSYVKQNGVWAPSFNNNSLESKKKNIELDDGCLEQILSSDICSFNWKYEDDGDQKHIGCIIADEGGNYRIAPKLLTHDKDAIDLYSMAGMSWKAIQELYDIIETQQEKINELEERLNGIN